MTNQIFKKVHWMILIVLFIVSLFLIHAFSTDNVISLNKRDFKSGEIVEITLNTDTNDLQVDILTPTAIYKYVTPSAKIRYLVYESGTHRINVFRDNELLKSETFFVSSKENK